uniref:Uncharacterized protein n=1 Tax=Trichuris muris TaxID=70415 RepID=A0A5S6Q2K8_TRIMR
MNNHASKDSITGFVHQERHLCQVLYQQDDPETHASQTCTSSNYSPYMGQLLINTPTALPNCSIVKFDYTHNSLQLHVALLRFTIIEPATPVPLTTLPSSR